jgi:arylsulfatase A-like enzyme
MRHITMIDECVGRVLDALDKNGQAGNTVVIVSSDNGYYLGEHMLSDKRSAYDESMRVPLVIHMPGKDAKHGVNKEAMVLNIDYGPTILDLAGAKPLPNGQGRSLRPLLTNTESQDWRTSFFYEYFKEPNYTSPTVLAARTNTSKLITYPGHEEWTEVFDLKNDPFELKNLVDDKALLKKMRAEFDAQAAAVNFHMPKLPNEDKADKKSARSTAGDLRLAHANLPRL